MRVAQEERFAQLRSELDSRNKQITDLSSAVQAARSEVERLDLQRKLAAARHDRDVIQGKVWNGTSAQVKTQEKCVCRDGDPMCGCLP